jgi:hypothetical protein
MLKTTASSKDMDNCIGFPIRLGQQLSAIWNVEQNQDDSECED